MAFVADSNMIANMWLRSGNTSASGNFRGFIEETIERLKGKQIGLVRLGSGYYDKAVFSLLESKELNYIVSAPMHAPLQKMLAGETKWQPLADVVVVGSSQYQASGWSSSRRIILIRLSINERPKAKGRQL